MLQRENTFLIILLCVPTHVLATRALAHVLDRQVGVANEVEVNLQTGGVLVARLERVEAIWPWLGRAVFPLTVAISLFIAPVALAEAPFAMGVPRAASPAVITVVVMVVVVRVVAPAPSQEPVLHVPVVHTHSSGSARHPQGRASNESSTNSESEGLLAEPLASVLANTAREAGAKLGAIAGRFVAVGVLGSIRASVTCHLGVDKASSSYGCSAATAGPTSSGAILLPRIT